MTCSIDIIDNLYFDRNLDYDEILETLIDGILEIKEKVDIETYDINIKKLSDME